MLVLPFSEAPAFSQEVTLDDVPYRFRFIWNTRFEFWSMSIFDREFTPIVQGIKVVLGYELISLYRGLPVPPGEIYTVDTTDEVVRIGRDDIPDGVVQLVYVPESEL
jgi:hypothetical protein